MDIKADAEKVAQFTFTRTAARDKQPNRFSRLGMMLSLAFVDALALFISCAVALISWSFRRDDLFLSNYVSLIPLILVFLLVYFVAGLYSVVGVHPVEELRQLCITTSVTFLGLGALSFWFRNAESYSRASFVIGWLISLFLLPIGREILRAVATKYRHWGESVAIIGFGDQGAEFVDFLQKYPSLGFNPVVLINGFYPANNHGKSQNGKYPLPMMDAQGLKDFEYGKFLKGIRTAIVIQNEVPETFLHSIVHDYGFRFSNLILVSDTHQFASLWVIPLDIGGVLGLRVRQNLMSSWQQALKRVLDLSIVILASPFLIPFFGLISLITHLDSPGAVFYTQLRIGQGGKKFGVWKFRTMVENADEVLEKYLTANPELRKEWEETHKLKNDPRITRMGRFLRKSSLDELPQILNVVRGDMGIVGPRPIIEEEAHHYGDKLKVYIQVRPGITGLWQVSGRNDLDYATRVRLDEYYVRNWSVWFDLYIIAKTPWKMITGSGAY